MFILCHPTNTVGVPVVLGFGTGLPGPPNFETEMMVTHHQSRHAPPLIMHTFGVQRMKTDKLEALKLWTTIRVIVHIYQR